VPAPTTACARAPPPPLAGRSAARGRWPVAWSGACEAADMDLTRGVAERLNERIELRAYVSAEWHRLLDSGTGGPYGANIGDRGENLTISFLSLNRATLSIRLLRSIAEHLPAFAGEVLVVDNGSDPDELARLRSAGAELRLRLRLVELGTNRGVGGGRNATIPHVRTDWLMCLDNDIYFVGDPLPAIQRDLAVLGCHFLSLPLLAPDRRTLFACSGHLYLSYEGGQLYVGAGSAFRQEAAGRLPSDGVLSTFLFGGACVFNRHTFAQVGGYDEAMFIGFEDIDFSIRLFRAGLKVGSTAAAVLVHDHPEPENGADRDYERQRFARRTLFESAVHLEKKWGFRVWGTAVDEWLLQRQRELGIAGDAPADHAGTVPATPRRKVGIVLATDTDGWAFSNIAKQVSKHLGHRFDFRTVPVDVVGDVNRVFLLAEGASIVHLFWREHVGLLGSDWHRDQLRPTGVDYAAFERDYLRRPLLSTAIYDHLRLDEKSLRRRAELFRDRVSGYYVASQKLRAIYEAVPDFPRPLAVLEDGVDLDVFRPRRLARFDGLDDREVVIGWAGNSKWAAEVEDFKGVHTILKPAIAQLREEGYRITTRFADRQERRIAHEDMPAYYAGIDVYVCTSKIEGTPNPVLEAMACGVPVVTTDVGIVPQAFGPQQMEFVLAERSVDALQRTLRRLLDDKSRFAQLSRENLEHIQAWSWRVKARAFEPYFDALLARWQ